MTLIRSLTLVLVLTFVSCKQEKTNPKLKNKRIIVEDVIAEGDISSDTVFNGLMKFYDTTTNKLVIEAFYKNGNLDGKRKDYYLNGNIKSVGYYEDGKQNGTTSFFDTVGRLISKQQFYYDLRAGSHIEYKNKKPSEYYFTSLENSDLFYINYDSIYNKKIEKLNEDHFFFWHINPKVVTTRTDKQLEKKEGFIYLINPPNFNFEYSLCIINNKDSILRVAKQFDKTKIWDTFILDPEELRPGERFTLRLAFDRDFNGQKREKGDMLKRL